jgi:hypothetical protein
VYVKTTVREQRALLTARSVLTWRLRDIENGIRGLLRGFWLRLPRLPAPQRRRLSSASSATHPQEKEVSRTINPPRAAKPHEGSTLRSNADINDPH